METHEGGRHCGRVRFRVTGDLADVTDCNCSMCTKKGILHLIVPQAQFELLSGRDDLTTYTFNTGVAQHHFCRHCGVRAFGIGTDTPIGTMIGINLGCLEGVSEETLANIPITCVDGMHDRHEPPEFASHL